MEETEKSLDAPLWLACAGSMVQIPSVNSMVYYFPQGHAEHTQTTVDFPASPRIPSMVLCRVSRVVFLADSETDEVYAKIKLIPEPDNKTSHLNFDDGCGGFNLNGSENPEKPSSFAKTLTQSDANNGGGFSVPRYCAETIFPPLDFTADPPVQTVIAKDVHGEVWKFRHIYRGTPRRHLLTTGWSAFVNQKKLVAGDSIVFLKAENGDLCVGIRRAKRCVGDGSDSLTPWNPGNSPFTGFSAFLREDEAKKTRSFCYGNLIANTRGKGENSTEAVVEAAVLAVTGQEFEVVYYPRASTPEFYVKADAVRAAMRVHWCLGMRFKMAFETEDSSRISWFSGTVSSVQVADPIHWPGSLWRLLQVNWDEPDLLQNVKRVSPWLVEMVSNMPVINLTPFSPPRKKLRFQHNFDFPLNGQYSIPSFTGNPIGPIGPWACPSENSPIGIQGARHAQYGISLSNLQLNNKPRPELEPFLTNFQKFDPHCTTSTGVVKSVNCSKDNVSCLLSMGSYSSQNLDKSNDLKKHQFLLFGQIILTEQQMLKKRSNGVDSINDIGNCKVFMESEDLARTIDLSLMASYEELYENLSNMFGIELCDSASHILYHDPAGAVKQTGDEPFSEFVKTARSLRILSRSGNNNVGRTSWVAKMSADNGVEASNKAGRFTIYA